MSYHPTSGAISDNGPVQASTDTINTAPFLPNIQPPDKMWDAPKSASFDLVSWAEDNRFGLVYLKKDFDDERYHFGCVCGNDDRRLSSYDWNNSYEHLITECPWRLIIERREECPNAFSLDNVSSVADILRIKIKECDCTIRHSHSGWQYVARLDNGEHNHPPLTDVALAALKKDEYADHTRMRLAHPFILPAMDTHAHAKHAAKKRKTSSKVSSRTKARSWASSAPHLNA